MSEYRLLLLLLMGPETPPPPTPIPRPLALLLCEWPPPMCKDVDKTAWLGFVGMAPPPKDAGCELLLAGGKFDAMACAECPAERRSVCECVRPCCLRSRHSPCPDMCALLKEVDISPLECA